ncbi:hypothetical protein W97_07111 [Coniosporium apollinis CBS 100218]|uniref:Uncharacterized protein n=1 Tax=Coniosporium apollinis (strain CBS 100218) TaxID=1168221 RepID=R7Z187_CONA1|nr:uncharacterized protein W97_07111 [Coniosporium apollinis CBS 100218]EON67965.1 hypothetical protein W97_07111 [Coniosporium apollinis CBS 100218]
MATTSGGDLSHFAISSVYGELLSEMSILTAVETGLLEFVCCLADGLAPQAKGHFFGSRNLGASGDTMRATIVLVDDISRQLGVGFSWKNENFAFLEKVAAW